MRIGRGCERCRVRHIRCTTRAGASACNACTRLGRVCRLDPPFRFKAVRHVYQKSNGIASKFELAWDPRQTWVDLPQSCTLEHTLLVVLQSLGMLIGCIVKFVQESSDDSDGGNTTDAQPDIQESHDHNQAASDEVQRDISDQISIFNHLPFPEVLYSQDENIRPPHVDSSSPPAGSPVFEDPPIVASSSGLSPSLLNIVSPLASASTWTSSASPLSSVSPRPSSSPPLSSREAHLLRLFIQKIAPWVSFFIADKNSGLIRYQADICDLRSHFSTEVPRRALQFPMVLKAVLCLAARHDAIMSNASDWEASEYHGQCLELLIAALALPEETYDDNLLITVVTLRIYEELECATDEKCHWVGSNRLLNTMSKSASSGGLAEAVSWQFLRQAIYASLVQHQPMHLDLANYELSSVFQRRDDASYANIIIFLCAKIIKSCWGSHYSFVDEGEWQHLSESVEQWHRARPISWQPLQYKDSDPAENRPFPELWMMSPPAGMY